MLKSLTFVASITIVFVFMAAGIEAKEPLKKIETQYPSGKKKQVYTVDADGNREGLFIEYYENGKTRGKANFRQGKLHGRFQAYHPNGKLKTLSEYKEGKLHGKKTVFNEKGKPTSITNWAAGLRHGPQTEGDGQRLTRDEIWCSGELVVPRGEKILHQTYAEISKKEIKTVGQWPKDVPMAIKANIASPQVQQFRENALKLLMFYRYMVGVPWEDIVLDRECIAYAEGAAFLLRRAGMVTFHPENPGLTGEEYRFGMDGLEMASIMQSTVDNLTNIPESVRQFVNDSSTHCQLTVCNRRWCLNPGMSKTGFGNNGNFPVMWSRDRGRSMTFDYDWIAFPPRGMTPSKFFPSSNPWSISFNPEKYKKLDLNGVNAKIYPATFNKETGQVTRRSSTPMELNIMHVDVSGCGIYYNVSFRPKTVVLSPSSAFVVEISGVKTTGGADAKIEYPVIFCR